MKEFVEGEKLVLQEDEQKHFENEKAKAKKCFWKEKLQGI